MCTLIIHLLYMYVKHKTCCPTTATRVEQQHVGGVMNFQDPADVLKADLEKQSKPKNIRIDPTKTQKA